MKVLLDQFITMWDEAAKSTLGSEFRMDSLLAAQNITNKDGSSILDNITFDDRIVVEIPVEETTEYFKAPWEL